MKPHLIHIPKTGGSTVAYYGHSSVTKVRHLTKKALDAAIAVDGWFLTQPNNRIHARWKDLKHPRGVKYVSIVRNPWAHAVSRYGFGLITGRISEETTFEEFLENRHNVDPQSMWKGPIMGWRLQKDYVTDAKGVLKADILRTEHLRNDMCKYFTLRGVLKSVNVNETYKFSYLEMYNISSKKIIADWFGEDIEFFGFSFSGAATKNIIK